MAKNRLTEKKGNGYKKSTKERKRKAIARTEHKLACRKHTVKRAETRFGIEFENEYEVSRFNELAKLARNVRVEGDGTQIKQLFYGPDNREIYPVYNPRLKAIATVLTKEMAMRSIPKAERESLTRWGLVPEPPKKLSYSKKEDCDIWRAMVWQKEENNMEFLKTAVFRRYQNTVHWSDAFHRADLYSLFKHEDGTHYLIIPSDEGHAYRIELNMSK